MLQLAAVIESFEESTTLSSIPQFLHNPLKLKLSVRRDSISDTMDVDDVLERYKKLVGN